MLNNIFIILFALGVNIAANANGGDSKQKDSPPPPSQSTPSSSDQLFKNTRTSDQEQTTKSKENLNGPQKLYQKFYVRQYPLEKSKENLPDPKVLYQKFLDRTEDINKDPRAALDHKDLFFLKNREKSTNALKNQLEQIKNRKNVFDKKIK